MVKIGNIFGNSKLEYEKISINFSLISFEAIMYFLNVDLPNYGEFWSILHDIICLKNFYFL